MSHESSPKRRFPWYDSAWLACFVRAKAFIASRHPSEVAGFVEAMQPLRTDPAFHTKHLGSLLEGELLGRIRKVIAALNPADLELHEIKSFGRWVVHDHPILAELQDAMTRIVSDVVGEPVASSYNFLSLYTRLGKCPVHMDAPFAKWTLDICIDQSDPWPIHFSQVMPWPEEANLPGESWESQILGDASNRFESFTLEPGEAVVFSGSSQWHYRDSLPSAKQNAFCHLMFFHFVPAGVAAYIDPKCWEGYFDIPGLGEVIGDP